MKKILLSMVMLLTLGSSATVSAQRHRHTPRTETVAKDSAKSKNEGIEAYSDTSSVATADSAAYDTTVPVTDSDSFDQSDFDNPFSLFAHLSSTSFSGVAFIIVVLLMFILLLMPLIIVLLIIRYFIKRHNDRVRLAEKAMEICGVFLLRAYLDGSDMHARQKMHVASCLAGLSFNTAGLGITHSMAHQLGAMFHIPHGRANAMLLPHIVEFNANVNKRSRSQKTYLPAVERYASVAHILGLSNYNQVMSVRSLVNWIQFMQKEMNIPMTIQELGTITPDAYFAAVDKMAEAALADACTPTNPRTPTKEDIIKIYTKLWSF